VSGPTEPGETPPGADAGGAEFSVGGLTPEQRRSVDDALRAQGIDASWLGTTLRVPNVAAAQVQLMLDQARRGGTASAPYGGGLYPAAPSAGGPYAGGPYPGGPYGGGPYGGGSYPSPPVGPGGPAYGGPYGGGPYAPYGGFGYPMAKKTNGLAIASLVLGILAVFTCYFGIVFGLVAVVLGLIARRQIRDRDEQGAGMALAGMIMGGAFAVIFIFIIVVIGVTSVTNPGSRGRTLPRVPATPPTTRESTGRGTTIPLAPGTTNPPSGLVRLEACPRVRSAYRSFLEPEAADSAILSDAARTLHAELPPVTADDIDLILVDSRPRAGRDRTGARPSEVQAALDRMGALIDDACPI
jgi:hypothetical protein